MEGQGEERGARENGTEPTSIASQVRNSIGRHIKAETSPNPHRQTSAHTYRRRLRYVNTTNIRLGHQQANRNQQKPDHKQLKSHNRNGDLEGNDARSGQ